MILIYGHELQEEKKEKARENREKDRGREIKQRDGYRRQKN